MHTHKQTNTRVTVSVDLLLLRKEIGLKRKDEIMNNKMEVQDKNEDKKWR